MHFGGTQREHGRPDVATRLRLFTLEMPDGMLDLGGEIACIATDAPTRPFAAESIARAVIGPRRREIDGTIEIAGRFVALKSLPAPLLRPSAPALVNRAMFEEWWRVISARQRADVEAAHAQRRLDRHRTDAAIERARSRANAPAARATSAPPVPVAVTMSEPQATPALVVDTVTPVVVAILEAFDQLGPVPSPAALALAEAFDELNTTTAQPGMAPSEIDLVAAEQRVENARHALAGIAGGMLPQARTRIETCHRAVVETERLLFDAGKKERPVALAHYQAALADERAALSEAGVDSYASFLVTNAAGFAPVDVETRLRAELDLAHAEATLEQLRAADTSSAHVDEERGAELRARAAQLLGRFPGADPAAELRGLRVENPDADATRDALRQMLAQAGERVGADVVAQARAFVQRRTEDLARGQRATDIELHALLDERASHEQALAAFEARLEAIDARRALSVEQLDAKTVTALVSVMLDQYRNGELLAGRLPLVLDGPFDGLEANVVVHVANQLATATDVQTIVVTGNRSVVSAFAGAGARTVMWPLTGAAPSYEVATSPSARLVPAAHPSVASASVRTYDPSIPSMCRTHPSKVAAAECARCGRGA